MKKIARAQNNFEHLLLSPFSVGVLVSGEVLAVDEICDPPLHRPRVGPELRELPQDLNDVTGHIRACGRK